MTILAFTTSLFIVINGHDVEAQHNGVEKETNPTEQRSQKMHKRIRYISMECIRSKRKKKQQQQQINANRLMQTQRTNRILPFMW
jgi:uncharacterized membrane protein YhiD involved in acid resistance